MLIHRMIAIFENMENRILELSPGLNILQTSKEADSAIWCAFLLSMFYGAEEDSAESGAVSGRLDCQDGERELILMRTTSPGGPPMEAFRAMTSESALAPDLTGRNCGAALLGASREEYVRGALIDQKGRDPEQERRIASILPLFEEPGEFSAAIKEEVNYHRRGRTGLLPALEEELQETTALLATREALANRLETQSPQETALVEQIAALEEELASCDRWKAYQQCETYRQAEESAIAAEEKASAYRNRLAQEGVPEMKVVSRLRGAIVNLNNTRKSSEQTRQQLEQASEALLEAETHLNESPFVDMTKEEALALPLHLRPKPKFPCWGAWLLLVLGIAAGIAVYCIWKAWTLAVGAGCVLSAAAGLLMMLSYHQKKALWDKQAEQMQNLRNADLAEWERLLKAAEAARADNRAKSEAWETLQSTLVATEQGILQEVRRFAPGTTDIPSADTALRAAALLRKELSKADAAAQEARTQCAMLPTPEPVPDGPVTKVHRSREIIQKELEETRSALTVLRSELERLNERLNAIGDPDMLQHRAETLADQIAALQKAYTALSGALSESEKAGDSEEQALAFGRRTAEIFAGLICGTPETYPEERPHSEEDSAPDVEAAPSEAPFTLTPDVSGQLYLALRLAACQLTLSPRLPIILDGALAGLEDENCEAALRWLQGAAKERQILLFTHQDREASYFFGDSSVTIQQLDTLAQ